MFFFVLYYYIGGWVFSSNKLIKTVLRGLLFAESVLPPQAIVESKALPETERLVGANTRHGLFVRRHAHHEHAVRMTRKVANFCELWVFPDAQLVQLEAVTWYELFVVTRPQQARDLWLGVVWVHQCACMVVPDVYSTVCCATLIYNIIWIHFLTDKI